MRKKETISLVQYLYCTEERLEENVKLCDYRAVRRDLDSLDLLEEIIAKERLKLFQDVSSEINKIDTMMLDFKERVGVNFSS